MSLFDSFKEKAAEMLPGAADNVGDAVDPRNR
jgi:hypothetical protein